MAEKKTRSTLFWGLLGCGVLMFLAVPVIGILAAIAIPAFMRYTEKSKAAESQMKVRQLGSLIQSAYMVDCKFPPALPPSHDPTINCGGENTMPDVSSWPEPYQTAVAGTPKYFSYQGRQLDESTYQVSARSDFKCGGEMHTVTVEVRVEGDCEVSLGSLSTENELQ